MGLLRKFWRWYTAPKHSPDVALFRAANARPYFWLAEEAANHARDLEAEHYDLSWRDRDDG